MSLYEAGSPSSDGRGAETTLGRRQAKPAHRYIYYRLYTKDGALESNNPIHCNDRFISRVLSKFVSPPHTGASLTRHLRRIEGFEGLGAGGLYLSLSEKTPVEGSARLSLRVNHGPGSSDTEPMALIVEAGAVHNRSAASTMGANTLLERRYEPRYVYYRVYDEGGAVASKMAFNEDDSTLGRIDTLAVPPPHNVASLKSCLVKVEDLSSENVQLFEDDCGETTMSDDDAIALFSDDYPGITEDEPIAIVYESRSLQDSAFSKKIKVRTLCSWSSDDPTWHSLITGEIFKTDGILRMEKYNHGGNVQELECYVAINSAGKKGFVFVGAVDVC